MSCLHDVVNVWTRFEILQTADVKPKTSRFPKIKGTSFWSPYNIRILPFRVLYQGPLFWETPKSSEGALGRSSLQQSWNSVLSFEVLGVFIILLA